MRQTTTSKRPIRAIITAIAVLLCCPAVVFPSPQASAGLRLQSHDSTWVHVEDNAPRRDNRKLVPHPHAHSSGSASSGYLGCFAYSSSELASKWIFKGQAPSCSTNSGSSGNGSGGTGSGSGGSGSSGSGGSGSSGSGSSGSGSSGSESSGSGSSGSGSSGSGSSGSGSSSSGSGSTGSGSSDTYSGDGGSGSNSSGSGSSGSDSTGNGSSGSDNTGSSNSGNGSSGNDNTGSSSSGNAGGGTSSSYGGDDNGGDGAGSDVGDDSAGVNGNNDDDTTNASEDPTANFDIGNCDTYSGLWMWDLSLTCDNVNTLDNCECSFAENLRDDGMLSCDDVSKCPTGCGVCMTCMRLLGCTSEQQQQGATTSSASSNIVPYLIAGAVSVILIAGVAYAVSHRKRKEDSSLGERLVDEEAGSEPNVFLAPVDSAAFDASSPPPDGVARVWLAPVNTEHDED